MCWSNARPLSYIRFLIHRRFRIIFARIIRTRVFILTAGILKGPPCFEYAEVRGAGSRNEYCRQLPLATDYLVRSMPSAPPSMLLLTIAYKGKLVRLTQSGRYTFCVLLYFIHRPIRCAFLISSRPACCSFFFRACFRRAIS